MLQAMRSKGKVKQGGLSRAEMRSGVELLDEPVVRRPRWRSECDLRPCPYISCRYNLCADVSHAGGLQVWRDPTDGGETCALDVAARGSLTLDAVGKLLDVTRERVRQIETRALVKLRRALMKAGISESDFLAMVAGKGQPDADAILASAAYPDKGDVLAVKRACARLLAGYEADRHPFGTIGGLPRQRKKRAQYEAEAAARAAAHARDEREQPMSDKPKRKRRGTPSEYDRIFEDAQAAELLERLKAGSMTAAALHRKLGERWQGLPSHKALLNWCKRKGVKVRQGGDRSKANDRSGSKTKNRDRATTSGKRGKPGGSRSAEQLAAGNEMMEQAVQMARGDVEALVDQPFATVRLRAGEYQITPDGVIRTVSEEAAVRIARRLREGK